MSTNKNFEDDRENEKGNKQNINHSYVTPSPTYMHSHPYYEKAYLRATKSDHHHNKEGSLIKKTPHTYYMKQAFY